MQDLDRDDVKWLDAQAVNRPKQFKQFRSFTVEQNTGMLIIIFPEHGESVEYNHWCALAIDFGSKHYGLMGLKKITALPRSLRKLLKLNNININRIVKGYRRCYIVDEETNQTETECGARACVFGKWFVMGHSPQLSSGEFAKKALALMQQWRDLR